MEESEEQAYWLQLLSDLGSQQALPPADVHTDENTNESLQSYMYLDHEENSHSDLPTQAFSLHHVDSSRDLASEAVAMNNDINNIPSSPIYGPILDFKSTNQYQISPSGEDEVSMALQRIGRLKKYSAPKTSKVWEDEYPVVLEIVKQDFIFTNTYTDITESTPESNSSSELNGEEDEEREEDEDALPDYSERQAATSNTDFVPARKNIRRTVSAQTRIVQSVSNATSEGLQRTLVIAGGVGSAMANTMTIVAQKVFEQLLEHLSQNFVVSSVVGCVHESANFISDRSKTLAALYLHQITFDDPEQMRLEKIKHASSWEHVLLRYSMATLSWKQRQLLKETRDIDDFNKGESMKAATLSTSDKGHADSFEQKNLQIIDQAKSNLHAMLAMEAESSEDDDVQYILARYFTAPGFCEAKNCCICAKTFGLALFRHHCRNCGGSVCEDHSKSRRPIFRYGMIQPVRVCDKCAFIADEVHRMDELMWKDGRVRAYLEGSLIHYHQQQLDRGIDKAIRLADYSLLVAKNTLTLNFPTKIVFETIEVLQRYGLTGFAGLMLRNDFMESIETLKKIVGMDKMFEISLHELTACVYYKLAIERGLRGCYPDSEAEEHKTTADAKFEYVASTPDNQEGSRKEKFHCKEAKESDVSAAIRYAPLALNVIYEENPVDMQRLSTLQGLNLIYTNVENELETEQPCYGLFGVDKEEASQHAVKEVILAIRGTQTIQDAVTDIKATPQSFPPSFDFIVSCLQGGYRSNEGKEKTILESHLLPKVREEWLSGHCKNSYACGGMARAAIWLLQEVGPSILRLVHEGYKITVVGHSLGGAVAALVTCMLRAVLSNVFCVTFGCPSCVDSFTSDRLKPFITTVIMHDDVVARITPQSIRQLLRDMMIFRSQIFRHLKQDWEDVIERSFNVWAPRVRVDAEETAAKLVAPAVSSLNEGDKSEAVLVEDEELATLWIPGKIIHLYFNRGQYLASEVNRDFPALRRIEVQGHMLDDHRGGNIMHALLEVRAIKRAVSPPPKWQSFNSSEVCSCCRNSFTWHSTFRGDAQEYRERYNCRHCGELVCGPCSSQKRSIPKYGLVFPRRVCDKCLLKGEYAHL